jgi:molecular chaperone GrpE
MDQKKKENKAQTASDETTEATEKTEATETPETKCDTPSQDCRSENPSGDAPQQSQSSRSSSPSPSAEPDWKDQYARLLADFDNFKKRTARDREDTYRFAEADILKDILPTIDNLALALQNAADKESAFVAGVQMVYDKMIETFKAHQAETFESVGKALDPELMEAIATLPSDKVAEGKVSNEVKRGWLLRGKLLRAAQVVVSSGKANG